MDELTRNAIRMWWHRWILDHAQDEYMNDGDGPARIDCWCNGWPGKPTTWKV